MTTSEVVSEKTNHRQISTPVDAFIIRLANLLGRGEAKRAKEFERFLKFAMVGTMGATVDFGTLNLLQSTVLPATNAGNVALATSIAFVTAVTSNFLWNRFWTYPDSRSRSVRKQVTQFFIVSTIGWLARTLWITLSYLFIGGILVSIIQLISPEYAPNQETVARLGTNGAQFIGVFVVMIWNFFANRYWTYSDVDEQPE